MKKHTLLISAGVFSLMSFTLLFTGSQTYDNFEGSKSITYGVRTGKLDTAANNPAPNKIDSSKKCAKYVRNGEKKFDNIKINLAKKLSSVDQYATYKGIPPKIKMKVYTTAPVGTLVEVLLGSKGRNNEYPAGTHSQYQAYTKTSGAWEELEFLFSQIPTGSLTKDSEIDQITLLFNPNSTSSDTYYFDDLTGPPMESLKVDTGLVKTPTKPENKKN
jgi:hypothetical protein